MATDLVITGADETYQLKTTANITCSSDLTVETIRWLNNSANGQELFSNSGQQQLLLPIERVSSFHANTTYTCVLMVNLSTGLLMLNKTITLQVEGTFVHYCAKINQSLFTDVRVNSNAASMFVPILTVARTVSSGGEACMQQGH